MLNCQSHWRNLSLGVSRRARVSTRGTKIRVECDFPGIPYDVGDIRMNNDLGAYLFFVAFSIGIIQAFRLNRRKPVSRRRIAGIATLASGCLIAGIDIMTDRGYILGMPPFVLILSG